MVCVVKMGETVGFRRVSPRGSCVFLRCVLDPAITGAAASKVCSCIQFGEFAGHVRLLRLNRAHKPRQTPLIERATALLLRLFRESRPHIVFRAWPTFLHRILNLRYHSSYRTRRLCSGLFSWGCSDTANGWPSSLQKHFACLTSSPWLVCIR